MHAKPNFFWCQDNGWQHVLLQALQQPNVKQFADAVIKEVNRHMEKKRWEFVKQEEASWDAQGLRSVWTMQRKHQLNTYEIIKHNTRLNLHGGKQVFGKIFFEPIVNWLSIRLGIIMWIKSWFCHGLHMELPQCIQTMTGNSKEHMLNLLKTFYGQKQTGMVWDA